MAELFENQILTCNKLAMQWLHKGNIQKSEEYISRAQKLLPPRSKSRQVCHLSAITLNNLGCIFKRKGNFPQALKSFEQALECEENYSYDILNLAGIHLNMSSIYSALNNHEISLRHALSAKKVLLSKADKDKTIWISLVIAYQAAGYEQECLSNIDSAKDCYLKGWELAQDHLGAFHSTTEKIKKSYQRLQRDFKIITKQFTSRSKTPSLLPKTSSISINDPRAGKPDDKVKNKQHDRAVSIKDFHTIDFLVSDFEHGKSESSTDLPRKSKYSKAYPLKKLKFERIPTFQEKSKEIGKIIKSEICRNDQDFKIETDDEYSDFYEEAEEEVPKLKAPDAEKLRGDDFSEKIAVFKPEVRTAENYNLNRKDMVVKFGKTRPEVKDKEDNNLKRKDMALNVDKLSVNKKIEEKKEFTANEVLIEAERASGFKHLDKGILKDQEVQTETVMIYSKDCQTEIKGPKPFRRIAAIIIQRFWRSYKKLKDPEYFEYLNEVYSAKIEAEKAKRRFNQIKMSYKPKSNKLEKPVPMRSKILI